MRKQRSNSKTTYKPSHTKRAKGYGGKNGKKLSARKSAGKSKKKSSWIEKRRMPLLIGGCVVLLLILSVVFHQNGIFLDIQKNGQNGGLTIENIDQEDQIFLNVYDHREEKLVEMDLNEYLIHVVSGEMPASYEPEALKAQSVAARTYTVDKMKLFGGPGCDKHPEADVCTDSSHCQAFKFDDVQKEDWGEQYEANLQKISEAVEQTEGMILVYHDQPILAMYHSNSGGKTEDVENVYQSARPYLKSVESELEEENNRQATETISQQTFVDTINKHVSKAGLTVEDVKNQVKIISHFDSGRVNEVQVGNATVTGRNMREWFGLKSTNFTVSFTDDGVVFETVGYGHGVGMSQDGANLMAKEGQNYEDILHHYYTDVQIKKISDVF